MNRVTSWLATSSHLTPVLLNACFMHESWYMASSFSARSMPCGCMVVMSPSASHPPNAHDKLNVLPVTAKANARSRKNGRDIASIFDRSGGGEKRSFLFFISGPYIESVKYKTGFSGRCSSQFFPLSLTPPSNTFKKAS